MIHGDSSKLFHANLHANACCFPGLLGAKALVRTVALLKVVSTDAGKRATSVEKVAVGKPPNRFIPGNLPSFRRISQGLATASSSMGR